MTNKQIFLIVGIVLALALAIVVVKKVYATVPDIETTPIGTSAGVWAETKDKLAAEVQELLYGKK